VLRLFSNDGTLIVEVDDPDVSLVIDGEDTGISGVGVKEIRLEAGQHRIEAIRDGKTLREEVVIVERNGKRVVRISREPEARKKEPDATKWEKSVAALPAKQRVEAVKEELKRRNPDFDGEMTATIESGAVVGLKLSTGRVTDLAPLRALRDLRELQIEANRNEGVLVDLSPLKGLPLTTLWMSSNKVSDLTPLRGMPLRNLTIMETEVTDLTPLIGMPLEKLKADLTPIATLQPLQGMKLAYLGLASTKVDDLSPLRGMPLNEIAIQGTQVKDLSDLADSPLQPLAVEGQEVDHPLSRWRQGDRPVPAERDAPEAPELPGLPSEPQPDHRRPALSHRPGGGQRHAGGRVREAARRPEGQRRQMTGGG
jgi:hypothetical protein